MFSPVFRLPFRHNLRYYFAKVQERVVRASDVDALGNHVVGTEYSDYGTRQPMDPSDRIRQADEQQLPGGHPGHVSDSCKEVL